MLHHRRRLVDARTVLVAATPAIGGVFTNAGHGVAYIEIASMVGAAKAGTAPGLENTTVSAMAFLTPLLIPLAGVVAAGVAARRHRLGGTPGPAALKAARATGTA
ncbi:hypothetical protein AB0M48_12395 [Lentzea sp. NPDC051208]|uniref:hypothetical protein n=1 Tax=Lentzea sp. NPDC051208 TaxID=3154642 RepID=UPI00343F0FF0